MDLVLEKLYFDCIPESTVALVIVTLVLVAIFLTFIRFVQDTLLVPINEDELRHKKN